MIDRRWFVRSAGGCLVALPFASVAQQPAARVARIGFLRHTSREPADGEALRQGLRELGYRDGRKLSIDERFADGDATRLVALARELVLTKVQVLVLDTQASLLVVRDAIGATPVVVALFDDPVEAGLVRSRAQPGGTVTGLTIWSSELPLKRLQLLREVKAAKGVGVLMNPGSPAPRALARLSDHARSSGVRLKLVEATNRDELAGAIGSLSPAGVGALLVMPDAMFLSQRARLVELAAAHRLAAIYPEREFADAGGLMAYAPSRAANFRRAATYVDRILKGARPGDLAIEQPAKIELVINRKTARALGLALPQALLLRADEVIP